MPECPLDVPTQRRNLLLFAACTALNYLGAPISYVGVTQASLCEELGASVRVSNLPATAYFAMTAMPVLIAWFVPYVSWLKRNLVICFASTGIVLSAVAVSLVLPVPNSVKIGMVILHGAVAGAALPAAIAFLWEVVGRGVAESRRGLALGLAFGAGPFLAFFASLGAQLILSGELGPWKIPRIDSTIHVTVSVWPFPLNFVVLYAAGVPIAALMALLSTWFVVPLPEQELVRQPFFAGVFGGLWNFLTDRTLLLATIVTILVYTGNTIPSNMSLYTSEVLGGTSDDFAGIANAYRFFFKGLAGLLLGWLLVKTHPKAGLLVTSVIFVASQVWACVATGPWYLLAFGIYGMGELVGVYAPNYILSASRPADIRRNMAFVTLMMAPAAPMGYVFGAIVDHLEPGYGAALAFRASFAVCAAIMVAGILLAIVTLPARPTPTESSAGD